ncbi:SHOCT domain-containing protein [Enterococcus plantarum]|uniref:SHOCT domain-containing protein n=1 Tax=Enterococcus plantarum TaxID=1077675 RepID=UPI001A901A2F|nr:SHOCT domain-containing protein [Enterococcus plantarum]MBO0423813.1 SHOCT domain-containing protein [Enterococcus plantarum]
MSFWGKNKKALNSDLKLFDPDKKIGKYIWIDNINKLLMISTKNMMKPKYLLRFDNIIGYAVYQDDKEVTKKSGLGRAAVGGLLFGGTGAVVGALTGSETTKSYVKNLWLVLELDGKNTESKKAMIPFIVMSKTDISSQLFKAYARDLESCMSALDGILSLNASSGNFDTLRKMKQLLDDGIITPAEFEIKKKELLNL